MECGSNNECPSGPSRSSSNGRGDEDDLDLLARVIMESNRYMLGSLGGFSEQRHKDFDKVLKVLSTLRGGRGGYINMDELREECLLTGVGLGGPSLRSVVWKLLLGYLPQRSGDWDATLAELRGNYLNERVGFVHDTVVARESAIEVARRSLAREGQPPQTEDVIEVQRLLDQINKDVYRTRPELVWLDDDRMRAMARGDGTMVIDIVHPTTHFDRMGRILFVYATLNPGLGYVQGMHELLAVMYLLFCQDHVLRSETDSSCAAELAEADAFYCLTNLMAQHHRDMFLRQLDRSDAGIAGTLQRFDAVLWVIDQEVYTHLAKEEVSADNFAFRWFTLLLSQEFESLQDVWRLWDCILTDLYRRRARVSNPHKTGHVAIIYYICAAMVELVRAVLLAGDFAVILRTLQHYPPFRVEEIISLAIELRGKYDNAITSIDLSSNRFMYNRFRANSLCSGSGDSPPSITARMRGGGSQSDTESPSRGISRGYRSLTVPPPVSPASSDDGSVRRLRSPLRNVVKSIRELTSRRRDEGEPSVDRSQPL